MTKAHQMPMKAHLFGLFLLVVGCASDASDATRSNDHLLRAFRVSLGPVRARTQGYQVLDVARVAPFAWDSVYFFNGEEGAQHIASTIGFAWTGSEVPNAHKRLLFVHQRRVVTFVDINEAGPVDTAAQEWPLHFFMYSTRRAGNGHGAAYARAHAQFAAFRRCEPGTAPFIALVPLENLDHFKEEMRQGCPN